MKLKMIVLLVCLLVPSMVFSQQGQTDSVGTTVELDLLSLGGTTREAVIYEINKKKRDIAKLEKKAKDQINIENITVENAEKWRDIVTYLTAMP